MAFLTKIPEVWKAAGVMMAVFMGGIGLGVSALGWSQVPEKVSVLEARTTALQEENQTIKTELGQVRRLIQQQLCLTVAEKQHTPWQNCVDPNDFQGRTPR